MPSRSTSSTTTTIGCGRELIGTVHDVNVLERHPIVGDNLKQTTTMLNLIHLYCGIRAVYPHKQLTPIAHVRKAYLV